MSGFNNFFIFFWIIIKTLYYLILHMLNGITDFFNNQLKYSSAKLREDEPNPCNTIIPDEVELFSDQIDWWDIDGSARALHSYNLLRIPFIRDGIENNYTEKSDKPLKGIKILDIGCGGGLVSEALAELGAIVTGIDAGKRIINVAEAHKHVNPMLKNNKPTYIATTIEEHIKQYSNYYDVVVASEVIDHVRNPEFFVKCCVTAAKPGAKVFFTAPNRTWVIRFSLIYFAEYVSKLLPQGTHHNENLVTPEELTGLLEKYNCRVERRAGFFFNHIDDNWISIKSLCSFYGLRATKME